ncbi:MAG: hypothetical protein AAF267_20195, partial [Deinococcota bacterium]
MSIQNISQLDAGIYQDTKRLGFTSVNAFLANQAAKGDISDALVNNSVAIPPVEQLLASAGIRTRGANASKCSVFFREDKANYVKGAEVLLPALVESRYTASEQSFFSRPSSPTDLLFPQKEMPFRDYTRYDERGFRVQLSDFIAETVTITGDSYKGGVIERDAEDNLEMARTAEATEFPTYTMKTGEREI